MRRVSLNARRAQDSATSGEIEVILVVFTHPSLDAPLRFSTDNTDRISTDPLIYGTRSTWDDADPLSDPYHFVLAEASVPGDLEEGVSPAQIMLVDLDSRIAEVLRSFTDFATCHMAVVYASTPDTPEAEFRDMKLVSVSGDGNEITLQITRL